MTENTTPLPADPTGPDPSTSSPEQAAPSSSAPPAGGAGAGWPPPAGGAGAGWPPPAGAPVTTMTAAPAPVRPPLRRSRDDRVIAGVAGGVGRWLGIDPVVVRVVLVVLAVFGGSGLLLYLAGWLLIPEDGASGTEANRLIDEASRPGSGSRTTLIVLAVVVGLLVVGSTTGGPWRGMWGFFGGGSLLLMALVAVLAVWLLRRGGRPAAPPPGTWPPPVRPAGTGSDPTTGTQVAGPAMTPLVPDYPGSPYDGGSPYATAASRPADPYTGPYTGTYVGAPDAGYSTGYAYGGYGSYPTYPQPTAAAVQPRPRRDRSYLGLLTLSVTVVVMGTLGLLNAAGAGIPAVVVLAAGLGVLGLGLLVGAFAGRSRWLIALALPLLLVTQAVSLLPAHVNFGNGVGDRAWAPTTVVAAADGSHTLTYRLDLGSATLDLTKLTLPAGTTTVHASVGTGELLVTVPSDVRVHVVGSVALGSIAVVGQPKQDGASLAVDTVLAPTTGSSTGTPADATQTLDLDLQVAVGNLEVSRA